MSIARLKYVWGLLFGFLTRSNVGTLTNASSKFWWKGENCLCKLNCYETHRFFNRMKFINENEDKCKLENWVEPKSNQERHGVSTKQKALKVKAPEAASPISQCSNLCFDFCFHHIIFYSFDMNLKHWPNTSLKQ